MTAAWLKPVESGVEIDVKVAPKSSKESIGPVRDDRLVVKVSAPPDQGKANKAVCKLVAARLGVAKSNVTVVSGETSRSKRLRAAGVTATDAVSALESAV